MTSTVPQIGQQLSAARKAARLTQRALADESGLSQSTIHRIEDGEREVSLLELSSLADACGVTVQDLLGQDTVRNEVHCAGRTSEAGANTLVDYLVYALGLSRRLDELGIEAVA